MHAGSECVSHTMVFAGALVVFVCAACGVCLRVPVYGCCGKRPSPMMGKKSAPKLEPVAPPLAVSCAPDAGARLVYKFPHRALCSRCASISTAVLRGRHVYGRNACVRCVPAFATQCSSQYCTSLRMWGIMASRRAKYGRLFKPQIAGPPSGTSEPQRVTMPAGCSWPEVTSRWALVIAKRSTLPLSCRDRLLPVYFA